MYIGVFAGVDRLKTWVLYSSLTVLLKLEFYLAWAKPSFSTSSWPLVRKTVDKTGWQKAKNNNENICQIMSLKIRVPTQIGKIVREVMYIQLNYVSSSLNNSAILCSPRPCYFASFTPTISSWFETKQILKLHICILMSFAVCLGKIIWDTFF